MNIHAAEHLDKARIVMVHDLAVTQVFGRDLGHFLISQGEVPDVDVLLHPLHMDGLGDDGHVPLGTPAEGHLGRDLAVLFAGVLLSGTFYIMSVDNSLLPVSVSSESVKMPCLPSDRGAHA